jgi:hypothetical protein
MTLTSPVGSSQQRSFGQQRRASSAVEMTFIYLAALRRLSGIKQTAFVRQRAEQVSRLLSGGVESHGRRAGDRWLK